MHDELVTKDLNKYGKGMMGIISLQTTYGEGGIGPEWFLD